MEDGTANGKSGSATRHDPVPMGRVLPSSEASQVAMMPSDHSDEAALPSGVLDVNQQQLDLRSVNSWLLKIDQVEVPELVEVFAINALAPFVLNSKFLPFLSSSQSVPVDRKLLYASASSSQVCSHTALPTQLILTESEEKQQSPSQREIVKQSRISRPSPFPYRRGWTRPVSS
jgi:hypothetical protein